MSDSKSELGMAHDPRLDQDEFRLYDWVNSDGRRLGRQNSDRATTDDAPSNVEHDQLRLGGSGDE